MANDLYQEWLNIDSATHEPGMPPNHYALLGLPAFCHHSGAIALAAKQRLEKLDAYTMLPDRAKRDAATRIMNEIATAKVALTDPKHYKPYDQRLAQQLGVMVPQQEVSPPSNLIPLDGQDYDLELDDEAPPPPTDQGGVAPLDASLMDVDGPQLDAQADLSAPRDKPTTAVPFVAIAVSLGVLVLLILGIVIAVIMMVQPETTDPGAETTAPTAQTTEQANDPEAFDQPATPTTPVAPANQPDAIDTFGRPLLGPNYRIRTSEGKGAIIADHKMLLVLGGKEYGQTRVEYTPMASQKSIKHISLTMALDHKATFTIAIANNRLRLTLKHTNAGIEVKASPGSPPGNEINWPIIESTADNLQLQIERNPESVTWRINNQIVATSPTINPRKTPTITFELAGIGGTTTAISNLKVWYSQ